MELKLRYEIVRYDDNDTMDLQELRWLLECNLQYITEVDSWRNCYAFVLTNREITQEEAQRLYDEWLKSETGEDLMES